MPLSLQRTTGLLSSAPRIQPQLVAAAREAKQRSFIDPGGPTRCCFDLCTLLQPVDGGDQQRVLFSY